MTSGGRFGIARNTRLWQQTWWTGLQGLQWWRWQRWQQRTLAVAPAAAGQPACRPAHHLQEPPLRLPRATSNQAQNHYPSLHHRCTCLVPADFRINWVHGKRIPNISACVGDSVTFTWSRGAQHDLIETKVGGGRAGWAGRDSGRVGGWVRGATSAVRAEGPALPCHPAWLPATLLDASTSPLARCHLVLPAPCHLLQTRTCNPAGVVLFPVRLSGTKKVPLTAPGTRHFMCSVGTHCPLGQIVSVTTRKCSG